ncbi:LacI family transcriptional regulator [Actinomyces capricornis]|uniref:LacI family transcriptional regulator n=1 Tax=Actinomyces capricornis TaxID=2755559 RepID=A0ABM7UEY8_9ACTO|nr:LacI family transcriptional regulator [Actinomyces capricornis]
MDAVTRTRVRLTDIAAACGVSTSTVSYVLAGKASERGLSNETVERVSAVANDLGYVRNRSARALRRGRTSTVVLFYEPPMNRFVERYLLRAARMLQRHGLQILALPVIDGDIRIITDALRSGICDGGIVSISRDQLARLFEALPTPPLPTVILGADKGDPKGYDQVHYEEYDAVVETLGTLVDRGSRTIAMAAQEADPARARRSVRWRAYEDFQRRRGAEPILLMHVDSSIPSAFEQAVRRLPDLRARDLLPDTVYCGADRVAIGLAMAASQLGIRVPEELSIVGTGNSSDALRLEQPLTSVGLSDESIDAVLAALIARLADPAPPASVITERWRLFPRRTTR